MFFGFVFSTVSTYFIPCFTSKSDSKDTELSLSCNSSRNVVAMRFPSASNPESNAPQETSKNPICSLKISTNSDLVLGLVNDWLSCSAGL